jgi:transposase
LYSLDFRRKVLGIKQAEGLSFTEVSARFKVGIASLVRWTRKIEPCTKRNKPATKIDMEGLKKDIETYPDAYQYERAQRLGVSQSGIRLALKRLGVSYKKKPQASESGSRQKVYVLRKA